MQDTQNQRLSPFDQIVEVEAEQERRVHDATATLEQERIAEEDALRARHAQDVEKARAAGREELVAYKNNELPKILQAAQERGAAERAAIEREGAPRVAVAAKKVVEAALSPDFSLSL